MRFINAAVIVAASPATLAHHPIRGANPKNPQKNKPQKRAHARRKASDVMPSGLPVPPSLQDLKDGEGKTIMEIEQFKFGDPGSIVGGTPVGPDEYNWFARATLSNGATWGGCGGSLVTDEFVLTAAHCIYTDFINGGGYDIGALCPNDIDNCNQAEVHREVAQIFVHPSYSSSTLNNDFALVKLESPVSTITPVPMDDGTVSPGFVAGEVLTAIGLGTTSSGGTPSSVLLDVDVGYVPNDVCNVNYSGAITDAMMCAADPGEDSCQGDSGGPLFHKETGSQVGVVSWGIGCANANFPGVYSRISDERAWIDTTICCNTAAEDRPTFCPANIDCGGVGGSTTTTTTPTSGGGDCTNTESWVDTFEDTCEWYETNQPTSCSTWGETEGTAGNGDVLTANEACCVCGGGNSGGGSTTTTTPTSGGSGGGTCTDMVDGWYDNEGPEFNCDWYADKLNCQLYGDQYENMGYTANQNCCVCDGGQKQCQDEPGWYDSDGPEFDCDWYADKQNCQLYGDQYANSNGLTANDACCVCGGGSGSNSNSAHSSYEYVGVGWCKDASGDMYDHAKFSNVASFEECAEICLPLLGSVGLEYVGDVSNPSGTDPETCYCRFENGSDVCSVGGDACYTGLSGTGPVFSAGSNSSPECYKRKA